MKCTFSAMILLISIIAKADDKRTVLIYEPTAFPQVLGTQSTVAAAKGAEPKAMDKGIFENTLNEAIRVLENSMRHTCAKEMETSISITAEGKWAVVGVSITGAIKVVIANPEMSKRCGK